MQAIAQQRDNDLLPSFFLEKKKEAKKNRFGTLPLSSRRSGKVCPAFQKLAAGGRSPVPPAHHRLPTSRVARRRQKRPKEDFDKARLSPERPPRPA
ncbi:hypothetical protein LJC74_08320 [Eubacteriales bacterium OttesenSCG-928-A19]|nr:hypothetical protein [Eubacteriales bacterium OttesenSCG-928-A19]